MSDPMRAADADLAQEPAALSGVVGQTEMVVGSGAVAVSGAVHPDDTEAV
jgi:hypothetical protein